MNEFHLPYNSKLEREDYEKEYLDRINTNLIINGNMNVNQRGTLPLNSAPITATNGTYYVDRMKADFTGVSTNCQWLSTNQPLGSVGSKSYRAISTTTGTGALGVSYAVEDYTPLIGKEATFSAKVKSNSNKARLLMFDGVATIQSDIHHSGDGEWEYHRFTFTPSLSATSLTLFAWTYDTGGVPVNVGDYIEVAELKLELGSIATPFVRPNFDQELARCQRYYYKLSNQYVGAVGDVYDDRVLVSYAWTYQIAHPSHMRATPSLTFLIKIAATDLTSHFIPYGSTEEVMGFRCNTTITAIAGDLFVRFMEVDAEM